MTAESTKYNIYSRVVAAMQSYYECMRTADIVVGHNLKDGKHRATEGAKRACGQDVAFMASGEHVHAHDRQKGDREKQKHDETHHCPPAGKSQLQQLS